MFFSYKTLIHQILVPQTKEWFSWFLSHSYGKQLNKNLKLFFFIFKSISFLFIFYRTYFEHYYFKSPEMIWLVLKKFRTSDEWSLILKHFKFILFFSIIDFLIVRWLLFKHLFHISKSSKNLILKRFISDRSPITEVSLTIEFASKLFY